MDRSVAETKAQTFAFDSTSASMTIAEVLYASKIPRLDAEILLGSVLQKSRAWLMAHGHETLEEDDLRAFIVREERRRKHEPLAYIVGKKEFFGRTFFVDASTLIPRPATEQLVIDTLQYIRHPHHTISDADAKIVIISHMLSDKKPQVLIDCGTGSGCIAISLALEGCTVPIVGVDISEEALSVARKNHQHLAHEKNITWVHEEGSTFVQKMTEPFLLVSNPPYIRRDALLDPDVALYEPQNALFAGDDGLDVLRPLLLAARNNPHCTGFVMEMTQEQVMEINLSTQ